MISRDDSVPGKALHPGLTLEIDMEDAEIDTPELAKRSGIPEDTLRQLLNAEINISQDIANALGSVKELRTPAGLWLDFQKGYEYDLAVIKARAKAKRELDELTRFPFRQAADVGWLTAHGDKRDRVRALWKFFDVDTLSHFDPDPATEFRFADPAAYDRMALAMWLRKGEIDAENAHVANYDKDAFIRTLSDITGMTRRAPSAFLPLIRERCADAGVAFTPVEALPGSSAISIARWRKDGTPWIQIDFESEWLDSFWWSFFLEAVHVLRGPTNRREVLHFRNALHIANPNGAVSGNRSINGAPPSEDELLDDQRAAEQARDWLLFQSFWDRITDTSRFTYEHIARCADEIAIHPGIIVSRLQAEGIIPHTHLNKLRERMAPAARNTSRP